VAKAQLRLGGVGGRNGRSQVIIASMPSALSTSFASSYALASSGGQLLFVDQGDEQHHQRLASAEWQLDDEIAQPFDEVVPALGPQQRPPLAVGELGDELGEGIGPRRRGHDDQRYRDYDGTWNLTADDDIIYLDAHDWE
jgi:hypothetical protein